MREMNVTPDAELEAKVSVMAESSLDPSSISTLCEKSLVPRFLPVFQCFSRVTLKSWEEPGYEARLKDCQLVVHWVQ